MGRTDLDTLIAEITVDAYGVDEQLWAFRQVLEDELPLPADGFVIGEPVSVLLIYYDGNERRGLTATCRREDGSEHVVSASEVVFPQGSTGARYLAAYRKWLGIDPSPAGTPATSRRKRQHKAKAEDLDLSRPVQLLVLSVKERTARCRLPGIDRNITLRAGGLWDLVPGEIVTVTPRKQWSYAGHPYLSGEIEATKLDVTALGLVPLRLNDMGVWNPNEHYWGGDDEPVEDWPKPIIARGPRPQFEMEQVLPGMDPEDPFSDLITESNDLKEAGALQEARKILMELCQSDLRCLDAHAHLGNLVFDRTPETAIHHYEVGLRIGELSLGNEFDGVLLWGFIDNRPFLRCLEGYGLCLWRLGRFEEAGRAFERILWLNPSDNQGVRFLIEDVKAGRNWEDHMDSWEDVRGENASIEALKDIPSWEWPTGAGRLLLDILRNEQADESERLLAAELAGEYSVINNELAEALLAVVRSGGASAELRGRAAISLGPVLEQGYLEEFEDPDDMPISEQTFHRIRETLRKVFMDAGAPKETRRQVLETAVRAPEDWHLETVRAAYAGSDEGWKLTAVFCMRFIEGFEDQILEALEARDSDIHYQAVLAAGNWQIDAAWPHLADLLTAEHSDRDLRLAAIEASIGVRPEEAAALLGELTLDDDEEIAEAAGEALSMAEALMEEEDLEEEFDDEDPGPYRH